MIIILKEIDANKFHSELKKIIPFERDEEYKDFIFCISGVKNYSLKEIKYFIENISEIINKRSGKINIEISKFHSELNTNKKNQRRIL